jgi:hypothetical protein
VKYAKLHTTGWYTLDRWKCPGVPIKTYIRVIWTG